MSLGGLRNSYEAIQTEPKTMDIPFVISELKTLVIDTGSSIGKETGVFMLIGAGLAALGWGCRALLKGIGGPGTTSWLGSHWSAWDRMTYRPYKGYNRLRSRAWNAEHTA